MKITGLRVGATVLLECSEALEKNTENQKVESSIPARCPTIRPKRNCVDKLRNAGDPSIRAGRCDFLIF
jgi:hypothetical protein